LSRSETPGLPSVSVVVPAYNAETTIDECVRSLLALRYARDRLELIVVDNGSRDRTREIVARHLDTVTLLDEARRGPSAARNAGIRRSRGSVIALTDADCTVDEGWLEALVAPLRDPSVGIAGGTILARRPATAIELYGESIHDHRRAIEVYRPPYVITMNWAARRSVLDECGPFDEGLLRCEDVGLAYRVGNAGYTLVYCPDAIVYHRNETTPVGLFREGWTHGYHGVAIERRYAAYIAKHRSSCPAAPAAGAPARPVPARFDATFKLGKLLGRSAGRLVSRA
jgi:glycosyltransferase involved in cell wall biosynthesis